MRDSRPFEPWPLEVIPADSEQAHITTTRQRAGWHDIIRRFLALTPMEREAIIQDAGRVNTALNTTEDQHA